MLGLKLNHVCKWDTKCQINVKKCWNTYSYFYQNQLACSSFKIIVIVSTCLMFSFYRWVGLIYKESMGEFGTLTISFMIDGRTVFLYHYNSILSIQLHMSNGSDYIILFYQLPCCRLLDSVNGSTCIWALLKKVGSTSNHIGLYLVSVAPVSQK